MKCKNCDHELKKSPIKELNNSDFCSDWCKVDYKSKDKKKKSQKERNTHPSKPLKNIKNNTVIRPFDKDSNKEISVIKPVE